ncbi:cation-transporting P-type ATPase [Desnuesiella massiliensis]|uniref:P-type ATPase n=1 Tax=Desnuesiella massiliensis TaxID=1650662 RepID=UPI0006E253A9|nr:cation-transporting P-type ATPase [Desnuesiella massiliensis]
MTEWYNNSWNFIVKKLKSDIYIGLKNIEIEERQKLLGKNIINIIKTNSLFSLVLKDICSLWVVAFLINIGLSLYNNHYIISVLIILLLASSLFQVIKKKYENEKRLKDLENLNKTNANVIRDGRVLTLGCEELVIGDIVLLEKNYIIPADLRIIESKELKIKETAVTGENYISEKYEAKIEERDINLSEMKNIAFKGSTVMEGSGLGIVIAVGMNTQIGRIVSMLTKPESDKFDINSSFNKIVNKISIITIAISCIYAIIMNYYSHNTLSYILVNVENIFLAGISSCIILVFGFFIMKTEKDLQYKDIEIKDISVLTLLPQINYIFMNKIGALTKSDVNIKKIYTDDNLYDIQKTKLKKDINLERILNIGLLCNDAKFNFEQGTSKGSIIEIALLKLGSENEMYKYDLESNQKRIFELSYDSDKRIMTTVNKFDENYRANIKGALDVILDRCTHIMRSGVEKELSIEEIDAIREIDIKLSEEGLITMGFAYRNFNYEPSPDENIESNLVFVGIIGFHNPINEEIMEDIKYCEAKNIKVAFSTEDNKLSSYAMGKEIQYINSLTSVLSGIEMDFIPEKDFSTVADKIKIFSRINSNHKLKVVKLLKDKGYKIATAGTNFTELPSMNTSHISLAVGEECSTLVKKLSHIHIKDNYFRNFVKLIKYSESFISNINDCINFICITFLLNIFLVLSITTLFNVDALNPYMILYLNSVIVPLCSFVILSNENVKALKEKESTINERLFIRKKGMNNILIPLIVLPIIILAYYYVVTTSSNNDAAVLNTFIIISFIYAIITFSLCSLNKNIIYYLTLSLSFIILLGILILSKFFHIKLNLHMFAFDLVIIVFFVLLNKVFIKNLYKAS